MREYNREDAWRLFANDGVWDWLVSPELESCIPQAKSSGHLSGGRHRQHCFHLCHFKLKGEPNCVTFWRIWHIIHGTTETNAMNWLQHIFGNVEQNVRCIQYYTVYNNIWMNTFPGYVNMTPAIFSLNAITGCESNTKIRPIFVLNLAKFKNKSIFCCFFFYMTMLMSCLWSSWDRIKNCSLSIKWQAQYQSRNIVLFDLNTYNQHKKLGNCKNKLRFIAASLLHIKLLYLFPSPRNRSLQIKRPLSKALMLFKSQSSHETTQVNNQTQNWPPSTLNLFGTLIN